MSMDAYGEVLRTIEFQDRGGMKWANGHMCYEAAIVNDTDDIKCLYVRVTNLRYVDEGNDTPEYFGTHFNIEWLDDEKQQDWLAWVIGETLAGSIEQSNNRTYKELKEKANNLLGVMGVNVNFG